MAAGPAATPRCERRQIPCSGPFLPKGATHLAIVRTTAIRSEKFIPMTRTPLIVAILALATVSIAPAARHDEMDYGRFLTASWDNTEGKNTLKGGGCCANKGIAIKLGRNEGAMLFDTDLCRWAGGWTGGFVTYKGVVFDGAHGPNPSPAKGASILFQTNPAPTWAKGASFADPRKLPTGPGAATVPFGPVPADWAKYRGLYLHGDNVIVSYTVGEASLLEMPALEKVGDQAVLTRTTNYLGAAQASEILFESEGATAVEKDGAVIVSDSPKTPESRVVIAGIDLPAGAKITASGSKVILQLPFIAQDRASAQIFKIAYAKGTAADEAALIAAAKGAAKPQSLASFTKGGPAHWTDPVKTALKPGTPGEHDAYVVDTVELPFTNPYKAWIRPGGFDFFADGRIAMSTWSGDVWVASGISADFSGEVTWKRHATGLFHALGLRIVKDVVYVLGRDQITRLHDLNGDGEADFYECFNNDVQVTPGFHEFTFDLQTDSKGNFYFAKGGPVNPGGRGWGPLSDHNGCLFKISPDGKKFEVFATGLRAPNGIGVGPDDTVTTGDNEGTWVPMCYVHIVKPGDFISVADLSHRATPPTEAGKHICYMPKDVDNSGGGQAWTTGEKWGLPAGRLLHLSYGTCGLHGVLMEKAGDTVQGGVFRFPLKFESGTMRARFSPIDGQLWISGLKGWQSSAAKDGCLQRVRYTGKKIHFPESLNVRADGIEIGFTNPLDAASASDAANYAVKHWNYQWTSKYGSDSYKPADGTKGREDLAVKSVTLSADRKRVFIAIDGIRPVDQMEIKMNIKGEDGTPVPNRILNTIHVVPAAKSASR